ncbi:MAG: hypothetical protein K0R94_955 [Burkholderiales bacterium]|nr:hypothetical protein [Burkholderiales bacterium]
MIKNLSKPSFLIRLASISLISLGLAACGSDNPPYVNKLDRNVRLISQHDTLQVFAMENYTAKMSGQYARFKVIYDLNKHGGNKVLIKSDTIIRGLYFNDGKTCSVTWDKIYAHGDQAMDKDNGVKLNNIATPTMCDPAVGLKYGEPMVINFNNVK